jgi:hypothetical protein
MFKRFALGFVAFALTMGLLVAVAAAAASWS